MRLIFPILLCSVNMILASSVYAQKIKTVNSDISNNREIYISDMSIAQPQSALSERFEQGKWCLFDYETAKCKGKMIGALSYINAPDVTIPLNLKGWYEIYVGYWSAGIFLDGETILKVRTTDRPAFMLVQDQSHVGDSQNATCITEAFYEAADLTGKDLVFRKSNGIMGRPLFIAYIKLVPLSSQQVKQILADRKDQSTRRLTSVIDGGTYFHWADFSKPDDILSFVDMYRYSDVGRILWAVNYGDMAAYYPCDAPLVKSITEWSDSRNFTGQYENMFPYRKGRKQISRVLPDLWNKDKIIPQDIAARMANSMGIQFDLMIRMGILGGFAKFGDKPSGFLAANPNCRIAYPDGTFAEKASYAYPETQDFMLGIIKDAVEKITCDGINLCFVRGPHLLWYEKPILDRFYEKYGKAQPAPSPEDPRLCEIRCDIMTEFVAKVRKTLDELGKKKNKNLELSVWVWPGNRKVWLGGTPKEEGVDVIRWVRMGLLDTVFVQEGIDKMYMETCQRKNVKYVLFTGYRGDKAMNPQNISNAYDNGVEYFAYWDMDCFQNKPVLWSWIRRCGHRDEMKNYKSPDPMSVVNPLISIDSKDVSNHLAQSVYSGG